MKAKMKNKIKVDKVKTSTIHGSNSQARSQKSGIQMSSLKPKIVCYTICVKKKALTTRQTFFVKHIAAGNDATQATVLAGYSKESTRFTASKLLTNDNIFNI